MRDEEDYKNPKKRWMILLGGITINTEIFEKKQEVEERFPFVFRDMLYGDRLCTSEWDYEVSGCKSLVRCAFGALIGQIIHLPKWDGGYERVKIEEVYINYWCQICAHGEVIEEPEEREEVHAG